MDATTPLIPRKYLFSSPERTLPKVSPDGRYLTWLAPLDGVSAFVTSRSDRHPDSIVVGLNDRDESLHDLYVINVLTGDRTLLVENPGYQDIIVDRDYQVRLAEKMESDGALQRYQYDRGAWQPLDRVPAEDAMATSIFGFEAENDQLLMVDSRGRDTAALVRWNLATGERETSYRKV